MLQARIAAFFVGFTVHFVAVGLFAHYGGVLLQTRPDLLALAENPGWYVHGGVVAPLFWAAFVPFLATRGLRLGGPPLFGVAGAAAVAVNAVFFALILTDGVCTFNACPEGGSLEKPFAAFYPNAVQSIVFDVGFFSFVALQLRLLVAPRSFLQASPEREAAVAELLRISPVLAALSVAHLASVAPVFWRVSGPADILMLAAFAGGAVVEASLAVAVHLRIRRLSADRTPRLGFPAPPPI